MIIRLGIGETKTNLPPYGFFFFNFCPGVPMTVIIENFLADSEDCSLWLHCMVLSLSHKVQSAVRMDDCWGPAESSRTQRRQHLLRSAATAAHVDESRRTMCFERTSVGVCDFVFFVAAVQSVPCHRAVGRRKKASCLRARVARGAGNRIPSSVHWYHVYLLRWLGRRTVS